MTRCPYEYLRQTFGQATRTRMKIRIQGNSLRLRLSQSEVKTFAQEGRVADSIQFGDSAGQTLFYVLETAAVRQMGVAYAPNEIKVFVPADLASQWTGTNLVGLEQAMELGNGNSLRILIEKDFQCLTAREGEDESDNFPNPHSAC